MKIETVSIPAPAGELEAVLNLPPEASVWVAVVCHPHPLFGGTLHNKVVFHTAKALAGLGWPVLRFNYRRFSRGMSDTVLLEQAGEDLRAVLAWMRNRFPNAFLCGAGFSFGSQVMFQTAQAELAIHRLIFIGFPAIHRVLQMDRWPAAPKLFVQGELDEFGPPDAIRQVYDSAPPPKRLIMIPEASHFFDHHLAELRSAVIQITETF